MAILETRHPQPDWARGMTSFEVLVSTILSQSTTVANERRGMEGLRDAFGRITPGVLATAQVSRIARAIWHAGLARQKSRWIREAARVVERDWGGGLDRVLRLPTKHAREALLALPGMGPKTADVVLSMAGHHATFPVDTHVARIARRWSLVRGRRYEDVRAALERWTSPKTRKSWHLAIIAHGRELCKARNPRCSECPVARDCDWYRGRGHLRATKS